MLRNFFSVVLFMSLSSCGTVYQSSRVNPLDENVRIIPLTAESVSVANSEPYNPKKLPAAFSQIAGGGPGLRGVGALPKPALEEQRRPQTIETLVPPPVSAGPYQIGVGDVLLLATKTSAGTVSELSGLLAAQNRRQGYTVQDDGAITIPDVGRIRLAGLTLEEAEAEVFQRLVENQIDPTFSLEISGFNSKRVSIGGAVSRPSIAPITLTPLTLDQAMVAAGGIAAEDLDFAVIRIYREGTLYQIPLEAYLSKPELQKTRLLDGDSIFVDTEYELEKAQAFFAEQITMAQFRQQARIQSLNELESEISLRRAALNESRENYRSKIALDAVDRDSVYLTGEVNEPGSFPLPFGRTANLADALFGQGGFSSETGNPEQIYILRGENDVTRAGAVAAWHLDATNAGNLVLATRMELRPNDIIFVAEQPITRWNRVISQIVPSLLTSGIAAASR